MFITIDEGKRGLLHRNGRLVRVLRPGRHFVWSAFARTRLEIIDIAAGIEDPRPDVEAMLPADEVVVLEVPIGHVALVTRLQRPFRVLGTGRWALWPAELGLAIELVDLRPLFAAIPVAFWPLAGARVAEVVVRPFERVLVWVDGVLEHVLAAGRHGLSTFERTLEMQRIDLREQELQVVGQELITRDKVTLRLNLVLKHRVVDPVLAVQTVHDLRDALYAEVQLVTRAAIAGVGVDELLERRGDGGHEGDRGSDRQADRGHGAGRPARAAPPRRRLARPGKPTPVRHGGGTGKEEATCRNEEASPCEADFAG